MMYHKIDVKFLNRQTKKIKKRNIFKSPDGRNEIWKKKYPSLKLVMF